MILLMSSSIALYSLYIFRTCLEFDRDASGNIQIASHINKIIGIPLLVRLFSYCGIDIGIIFENIANNILLALHLNVNNLVDGFVWVDQEVTLLKKQKKQSESLQALH